DLVRSRLHEGQGYAAWRLDLAEIFRWRLGVLMRLWITRLLVFLRCLRTRSRAGAPLAHFEVEFAGPQLSESSIGFDRYRRQHGVSENPLVLNVELPLAVQCRVLRRLGALVAQGQLEFVKLDLLTRCESHVLRLVDPSGTAIFEGHCLALVVRHDRR